MATLEEQALSQINAGIQSGLIDPMQAFALYYGASEPLGLNTPPPSAPDQQNFADILGGFNTQQQNFSNALVGLAPQTAAPTTTAPTATAAPTAPTAPFVDNTGVGELNIPFGADFYEPTLAANVDLTRIEESGRQFDVGIAEQIRQFNETITQQRDQFMAQLELQRQQFGLDQQQLEEMIRQFDAQQGEQIRQFGLTLDFQRQQFQAQQALQARQLDIGESQFGQQLAEQARQFDVGAGLNAAQVIAQLRANPAAAAQLAILQGGIAPGSGPLNAHAGQLVAAAGANPQGGAVFNAGNQNLQLPRTFSSQQLNTLNAAPDLASNLQSYAKAAGDPNLFSRSVQALVPNGFTGTGAGV